MANQIVTSDLNMEQVIANGLLSDEIITITSGAIVTVTQTPTVMMGNIVITNGKIILDGENIVAGNIINFIGGGGDPSADRTITIQGAGEFIVNGAWFDIGTTDGTDSQAIDLSTATGIGYWNKDGADFCVDCLSMIQIETGRRINFTSGVGIDPVPGDIITLISDRTVMAKVHSVGVGFVVVWMLTNSFTGGELIQIRKVVDNVGPDLQQTWTATVNGTDIKESDVYMEFGNSRSGGVSHIAAFGNGYGGLVFDNEFTSPLLTLGSTIGGGFVPPSGCNIRAPNVSITSSLIADYNNGDVARNPADLNEANLYTLSSTTGGTVNLSILNTSNALISSRSAFNYSAEFVGSTFGVGSNSPANRTSFSHCVDVQDPVGNIENNVRFIGFILDCVSGADVEHCMIINARAYNNALGCQTSANVIIKECIISSAGQTPTLDSGVRSINLIASASPVLINTMVFGNNSTSQNDIMSLNRCTDSKINQMHVSTTQDYTESTQNRDGFLLLSDVRGLITGLEFIGNGTQGNDLVRATDCINTKIRAFGMIDDKISFGLSGAYMVQLVGICSGMSFARMWKEGITAPNRREFILVGLSCSNTTVENCSGAYFSELQASGADDNRLKGVHGGEANFGLPGGWEDTLPTSYGNSFHDGFRSDTTGAIACLMITPTSTTNESTVIAGTPIFFKDGDLDMTDGDVIEFEMGYFTRGHISLTGVVTSASTTAVDGANEWLNVLVEFQWQLDDGNGWNNVWLDARVVSNLTNIVGNIASGIKFKLRFTASGTQANMSGFVIHTTTSLQAQKDNFYPIDQLQVPFKIVVLDEQTGAINTQARVHVVAGANGTLPQGSTIVDRQLVDASGEVNAILLSAPQDFTGLVVDASEPALFVPKPISGTITESGLVINVNLVRDE